MTFLPDFSRKFSRHVSRHVPRPFPTGSSDMGKPTPALTTPAQQSNKKIMKENVTLLQHYNDLKQELHSLKCESRVSDDSGSKKRRAEIA